MPVTTITRRAFLASLTPALAAPRLPILDIHCHPPIPTYRNEKWVLQHQRALGISQSILLPVNSAAGLDIPLFPRFTVGQSAALSMNDKFPSEYLFFTNADPRNKDAIVYLEKYLKRGALGIGEVKLPLDCDSPKMEMLYQVARDHRVPVLIHFQYGAFATGFERFYKIVEKYPQVNFIGHAQTWWVYIDRRHRQEILYPEPRSRVTPGGLTDILLTNYPNVYADLSASSGINAIERDLPHAREFIARHQDKLLYGSDCEHKGMTGEQCWGRRMIAALQRLAPSEQALRKIASENARRLLRQQS